MPPVAKMRGAGLLLVVGIILIIVGAFSAGGGLLTRASSVSTVNMFGLGEAAVEYFNLVAVISIVTGVLMLVFGILGIAFRKRADRVNLLIVLGIIHIIAKVFLTLYNNVLNEIGASYNERILEMTEQMTGMSLDGAVADNAAITIAGLVFAFILPALFLLGALLNKLPPKIPAHLREFYAQQQQGAGVSYMPQQGQSPSQPDSSSPYMQQAPPSQQSGSESPYEPGYRPPEEQ